MELEGEGRLWKRLAVAAIAIVVLVGLGSAMLGSQVSGILSTVGSSVDTGGGVVVEPDPGGGEAPGEGPGEQPGAIAGGDAIPLYSVERGDLLIVKSGSLTLQVAAIEPALAEATALVASLGGYASGSDRSDGADGDGVEAQITFRIPAGQWEAVLTRLRALGTKVLHEHSTTEDVTAQVVDIGARIANLRATEGALQEIMTRAGVISDVLDVQRELTGVRGEIEQLTAQQRHLREQAAMSTLALHLARTPANQVVIEQQGFDPAAEVDHASATLVGVLQELATVGIWFGIVWLPILLALAIVTGIGVAAARRVRRAAPEGSAP